MEKMSTPSIKDGGYYSNMSLRDWFAGMALMGFSAHPANKNWTPREIANDAYLLSDAMLAERERKEQL